MREMKESGIEWIGRIPKDWTIKRLKHVLEERKEKNNPIKSKDILSLSIDRGVFPYSEKTGGGNKAKEKFEDYKLAYPNDIVLNSMNVVVGSVGKSNYFGCVSPVYYTLFVRNNNYNIDYYNYIFQSNAFQKSLWGLGNGIVAKESDNGKLNTIRMRIPMEKLNNIIMPIPTNDEQERIANHLNKKVDEIDNAIRKTKQTIEDYKLYEQSIITRVVTKGLNENIKMKDSGIEAIGMIPKHWKLIKLKYIVNSIGKGNGITKEDIVTDGDTPCVRYGEIYSKYNYKFYECETRTNKEKINSNQYFTYGDLLFAGTGELVEEIGKNIVYLGNENCLAGGDIIIVKHSENPVFLSYALNSHYGQTQKSYGKSKLKVVHISGAEIGNMLIALPPLKEQNQIEKYISEKCEEIDKLINNKEKIIEELENYKKSLIYEYVTGKKEVKTNYNNTEMAELSLRIIEQLPNNYSMCKIKLNKIQSVILKMIKYKQEPDYEKYAAGPYSEEMMKNVYDIFKEKEWVKISKDNMRDIYTLDNNYKEGIEKYQKDFKEYDNEITRIIKLFKNKDTQESEIIATLFYCWNDFLIDGIKPTDNQIIEEFYAWSKRKKYIKTSKVKKCLEYMRNNNLMPNGYGKKTIQRSNNYGRK